MTRQAGFDRDRLPDRLAYFAAEGLALTGRGRWRSAAYVLARLGFGLFELADGTYLAARWDRSRPCADLRAVRQFLALLGVRG